MRTILAVGLIFCGLGLLGTNVALAQEHGAAPAATETQAATPAIPPTLFGAIGAGIGAGLVVMGGAAGIGRIGGSAVESMARQPEVAGSINMAMLITAAMVEGATLFGVIVCLMFALK
ncbi:MAG: ATP synthase F0 subunit C [Phycisphaerae bacterium]|nr:ATP synthase F0 subunit C [Phycisphaerae bacterium]